MRQEHQVGSLDNYVEELQQHVSAQRLELEDAQHGNIECRQEQVCHQEESSMKERLFLQDTQIRSARENHETPQKLTSRLQEMPVAILAPELSRSQVSIVAVSDHVFHSTLLVSCSLCLHIFALASCLNRVLLIHLAHRLRTHLCSSRLRILVLLMALVPTSMVWAPAGSTTDEKLVHFKTQISQSPKYCVKFVTHSTPVQSDLWR